MIIKILSIIVALLFVLCFLITRPRKYFIYILKDSMKRLLSIVADEAPLNKKGIKSVWLFLLTIILVLPVTVFFVAVLLVVFPTVSIIHSISHPERVDEILQFDKEMHTPRPEKPKKALEEIAEENRIWQEQMMAVRFTVNRKDLPYDPDEKEIFFYTPDLASEVENAIHAHYDEIKYTFEQKGYSFVFLPYFNKELNILLNADRINYYSPRAENLLRKPIEALSYQDIKDALKIPDKVDGPCFIRCKRADEDPLTFTFWKIALSEDGEIMPAVEEYLEHLGDRRLFHVASDDEIQASSNRFPSVMGFTGPSADELFEEDVYRIGQEIRERIEKLRAKGLSSLAIRKLLGDDSDKPGKLLIDKHNKVFLTDYGNKEIKMEPLQKAVFFLFLRHPEGIYFKDLGDYRDELSAIYKEITGRDDIAAIESSIDRLTDPLNNSINEKCARIKNAFVSEFREEVAQWYFIDGTKGEKKSIKLPRELVTWEIKD